MSWSIDPAHTVVEFAVRHMMLSKVRGQFEKIEGDIHLDEDKPEVTAVDVKIDTASINTRDDKRDNHLRSGDFFESEKYPYMTFKSKKVEMIDDDSAKLYGELTIKTITKPIVLDVEYTGKAKSPWGTTSVGFTGRTKISRKEWNLTWNQALETGGVLVGEDIDVNIELELVKN